MDRTESNIKALATIRDTLLADQTNAALRQPSAARAELAALKEQLRSVQEFNEQKKFLG